MAKTEVYSWRLHPELKEALERAARREHKSLAELLDSVVRRYLEHSDGERSDDEERARSVARRTFGAIKSGRSDRATRTRELVRERLKQRHGR